KDGKLSAADRDRLDVALFAYRAMYEQGARATPEAPLRKTRSDLRQDAWANVATGKGVLLLHRLRAEAGGGKVEEVRDAFGRAHAGKEVSAGEFVAFVEKQVPWRRWDTFFANWLDRTGLPAGDRIAGPRGGPFSVLTPYYEVEQALIVYGTADE